MKSAGHNYVTRTPFNSSFMYVLHALKFMIGYVCNFECIVLQELDVGDHVQLQIESFLANVGM